LLKVLGRGKSADSHTKRGEVAERLYEEAERDKKKKADKRRRERTEEQKARIQKGENKIY
jgi:hypothetical protein